MAKTVLCMQHNLEFPTEETFQAHKKMTHNNGQLPQGITPDMLPDPDFIAKVKEIEGKPLVNNPVLTPETLNTFIPRVVQQPTPNLGILTPVLAQIPIKLTYAYEGTCPDHITSLVDTLILNVANQQFALAYCGEGKHQVTSIQVTPIESYGGSSKEPIAGKKEKK